MFAKTVLSVYDQTGHFSSAYRREGYEVIQIDSKLTNTDARLLEFQPGLSIHGLIACPPCTYFTKANTVENFERYKLEGLSTLDLVYRLICLYKPSWYVIENPSESRIREFIGPPKQIVKLSDYGYLAKKGTGLWGEFNKIRKAVKPAHKLKSLESCSRKQRITTPPLLGEMFFKANP